MQWQIDEKKSNCLARVTVSGVMTDKTVVIRFDLLNWNL